MGIARLAIYIALIVGFQFMPAVALSLVLGIEMVYLLAVMIYFCRENYIRACYLATIKIF